MVDDFRHCHLKLKAVLESREPVFVGRIGGSDTDLLFNYREALAAGGEPLARNVVAAGASTLKRYNGFYDKAHDPGNLERFCRGLMDAYLSSEHLFLAGPALLSEFMPESINARFRVDTSLKRPVYRAAIEELGRHSGPAHLYTYTFVENILAGPHTLFNLLAELLPGKRVLVVSPFAQSITENFAGRKAFFPGYEYPDFKLQTYATPITYSGLPDSYYPDDNWFETVERMKREIHGLEFDIALLGCASYGMPLGLHIRNEMAAKAIYVGGVLQLFFGILGRRYQDPWFLNQINVDMFIRPLESAHYLAHVGVDPDDPTEAFGAYF